MNTKKAMDKGSSIVVNAKKAMHKRSSIVVNAKKSMDKGSSIVANAKKAMDKGSTFSTSHTDCPVLHIPLCPLICMASDSALL